MGKDLMLIKELRMRRLGLLAIGEQSANMPDAEDIGRRCGGR